MTNARVDCDALAAVYGAGAEPYDRIWSPVILPPAAAVVGALELGRAERVVDVGAGTGALLPVVMASAPHAHIAAVDPSMAMLRYAREHRSAVAVLADAKRLPFKMKSVDAVLLAYVLFHLLNPVDALREAARVLRYGGRAGTVTWANESPYEADTVWYEALEELGVPMLPAHGNHTGLDDEAAIAALLGTAGLHPERVWRERIEHTFEPDGFWQMRTGSGSNRARLEALDRATRDHVLEEVRSRLAQLQPTGYTFRGEVVCSVSIRR